MARHSLRCLSLGIAALLPCLLHAQGATSEAFRQRDLRLDVSIDFAARGLSGSATYALENWTARPADRVTFRLNRLMEAKSVRDGAGRQLAFAQRVVRMEGGMPMMQVTEIAIELGSPVSPGSTTTVRLEYGGNLVGYTETGMRYVQDNVDTAFTILRVDALAFPEVGSRFHPANRQIPVQDFTYDASIRVPRGYRVAAGGISSQADNGDGTITWRYQSGEPTPFMNISIARYDLLEEGGMRIFHFPADSAGARQVAMAGKAAMQTLAAWFGPLRSTPTLTIAEIPDGWGSQAHLVGGIIQTAASFRDRQRWGELYHELSHLWNAADTERFAPRWNEGLAMHLQLRLRERLDGWQGRPASDSALIASLRRRVAADSALRNTALIDYGRRSMTDHSYSVGRLMFATLYELVGESEFNQIIGGYYRRFPDGATTPDFIAFAKQHATRDLTAFFDDWILTPGWPVAVRTATSVSALAERYRR
jgi:hypothetical protein